MRQEETMLQDKKGKEMKSCSKSSYRGSSCSEPRQLDEDLRMMRKKNDVVAASDSTSVKDRKD